MTFSIAETCPCGAHISSQGNEEPVLRQLEIWRRKHRSHANQAMRQKDPNTLQPWRRPGAVWQSAAGGVGGTSGASIVIGDGTGSGGTDAEGG